MRLHVSPITRILNYFELHYALREINITLKILSYEYRLRVLQIVCLCLALRLVIIGNLLVVLHFSYLQVLRCLHNHRGYCPCVHAVSAVTPYKIQFASAVIYIEPPNLMILFVQI